MEQEQASADVIRPFIKERYPMYQENPAFEQWLSKKAGNDQSNLAEYLELLQGYGFIGGDGTITAGYETLPEPAGVQADIEGRLSLLGADTLALLRLASVEGDRFSAAALKAIAGEDAESQLQPAIDAGVVARDSNPAEIPALGHRYRFVPLQVRQLLYDRMPDAERADAHTALVEYLSRELEHTEEVGAQDMLNRLISQHNKRVMRPDPPIPPDPKAISH